MWITGRRKLFDNLSQEMQSAQNVVWMHCASLGEFEQGRPLIEAIKAKGEQEILLTFYSPSGYEIRKDYPQADYVYYLPLDTKKNAEQMIDIVRPQQVIFVKYEIWYHFLNTLQERKIPTMLIAALFREKQFYFRWYGKSFIPILQNFTQIFVQDEASKLVLQQNGISNAIVAGDTRVDRVLQIASSVEPIPIVEKFVRTANILVAGSTWAQDESILIPFINQAKHTDWQFVIAPHEIDIGHIEAIKKQLNVPFICYSQVDEKTDWSSQKVLIIDNIGLLSRIYQYAKIAYIGGGFGTGIHNILEPAVFEIPVIFGPKYQNFSEARTLVAQQGAFAINDSVSFERIFKQLQAKPFYQQTSAVSRSFINNNKGATEKIMRFL